MNNDDFDKNPYEQSDPPKAGEPASQPDGEQEAPGAREEAEQPENSGAAADTDTESGDASPDTEKPADGENRTDAQDRDPYAQQEQNPYTQQGPSYGQDDSGRYGGPYGNPYGGNYGGYSQNPYGQNNGQNPYGQNQYGQSQYGQNPYGQNRYDPQGQQYWTYQQYGGQHPYQNPRQPGGPGRKNTGLKVFLWILGVLIVGSVLGFSIYGVYTAFEQKGGTLPPNTASSQAQQENGDAGSAASSGGQQAQSAAPGDGTNPNASGIEIQSQPAGNPLSAKDVYKKVVQSVVGVETAINNTTTGESGTGQGTGIIASSDGYILTNAHVVNYSRANKVTVILYNKKEYAATVVGFDKTSDIAVLKINASNLSPATFGNADQLEVGDQVIAIGNPGGLSYASSLTGGYVSALNRTIETHSDNGMTYIQTDAAINPGNSGGPLVNMYGQVVGINSNKIVATGFEGMGFAIPVSKAKSIIDDLVARGYVTGRSRLGITATEISAIQSQLSGLPAGVMIREIGADSDLKKSNVVTGDIITKADGQTITSLDDLYAVLNKHKAGDTITLTIYSQSSGGNGTTRQVKTKLLEDKGETQAK